MTQYHKTAHTVFPNELNKISLSQESMPHMTTFHHSQFHCSIYMELDQILGHTFLSQKSGHGH